MAQEVVMDAATRSAALDFFKKGIADGSIKATNKLFNPATLVLGAIFDFTDLKMEDDGSGNWIEAYHVMRVEGPGVTPLNRESRSPLTGLVLANKGELPVQESLKDKVNVEFPIRALMGAKNTSIVINGAPVYPGRTAMSVVKLFQSIFGKVIKVTSSMKDATDTITLPGTNTTRQRTCYEFTVFDTLADAQR